MAKSIQETKRLTIIFDAINAEFFNNEVTAGIGWRKSKIGNTKVTLGSCNTEERFIRINSVLQDPEIPNWFLIHIVHHEMIHAYQSKWRARPDELHNEEFQRLEQEYRYYERAKEFQLTKLPRILAGHRKKKPMSENSA